MNCLGCGTPVPESALEQMEAVAIADGGDPESVTVRVCAQCPPEKIAQFEQERIERQGPERYQDHRSDA